MSKEAGKKAVTLTAEQKVKAKQDTFTRVVTPRVNKALKAIGLIANCSGSAYLYTPEQAKAVLLALQVAVQGVADAYAKTAKRGTEFSLPK